MMRNVLFDIIRHSQHEDNVIIDMTCYQTCGACDELVDTHIKVYDVENYKLIYMCKDCFCNENSGLYSLPLNLLGQVGYICDDVNKHYLFDKYNSYIGGNCYGCGKGFHYGIDVYIHDSKFSNERIKNVYLCEDCYFSQKWISEEVHINCFERKGIKVLNESKDNSK